MNAITVSITSPKPYIGRITGPDARFGFSLDFLPLNRKSATYHTAAISQAGDYKITPGATVGTRRIDTGFIRIDEAGAVTEIQKNEVML